MAVRGGSWRVNQLIGYRGSCRSRLRAVDPVPVECPRSSPPSLAGSRSRSTGRRPGDVYPVRRHSRRPAGAGNDRCHVTAPVASSSAYSVALPPMMTKTISVRGGRRAGCGRAEGAPVQRSGHWRRRRKGCCRRAIGLRDEYLAIVVGHTRRPAGAPEIATGPQAVAPLTWSSAKS